MTEILTKDSMGRSRRLCPICGFKRYPGKAFPSGSEECYYCERRRVGVKKCSLCKEMKPLDQFPGIDYKVWRCGPCLKKYQAKWREANREKISHYQRKHHSGVTREQFEAAVRDNPSCPLCLRAFGPGFTPHADHSHANGKFRGVLCGSCNRGIGLLRDDAFVLRRAALYLEQY